MEHLHSGSAGLSAEPQRRDLARDRPRTPEPFAVGEARLPSPPRPRLKLKRRNVSRLSAPTQQFLASVAAADVPIPSIEEPEIAHLDADMSDGFPGMSPFEDEDMGLLRVRGRAFSPPKTPAPGAVPSLSPSRYPDWSIDSAFCSSAESSPDPECASSRPSTSRSTQTSSSLFSRLSQSSDDEHCPSLEAEGSDRFTCASSEDGLDYQRAVEAPVGHSRRARAPWTKAMSSHLWSTYILYLQDPKVTPFRIGKSCIPPHGVCLRVARQAKRSWKGAKALSKAYGVSGNKSGSTTPTAETSGSFMEWPHTCAATRAHLRELCKLKASTPGARGPHLMSRSPTPFTQAANRHWNRRSTPARSPSVFSTQDMAMSLTVCTSEVMQPEGPLAQLTSSLPESTGQESVLSSDLADGLAAGAEGEPSFAERRRLGSPFTARSYGPSSSSSLAGMLGLSNSRQSHTIGPRRTLQSPVRLSRSATQKRRTRQSHELRKRPVLATDIFTDPAMIRHDTQFSSTSSKRHDELFIPRIEAEPLGVRNSSTAPELSTSRLMPPAKPPLRLGSPFSGPNTSFSFPSRSSQPVNFDLAAIGRPFSTVQRPSESAPVPARTNLASRLAYIDQRLKEFNRGDVGRRRSESPL